MSATFATFAGVGPSEALIGAGRHLRAAFDPTEVHERFEAHAEPRSLLALVEIADAAGIAAEAFHGEISDLPGIALPSILHLQDPTSGEGCFALLVARDAASVTLENPTSRARARLTPLELAGMWTGALVVPKVSDREVVGPAPFRRPLLRRVAGDGPLAPARAAAFVAIVALALRGAAAVGIAAVFGVALLLAGTIVGLALIGASRKSRVASAASRIASVLCRRGSLTDCEGVLTSKWAHLGPIELSSWGFALFASALGTAAAAGFAPNPANVFRWIAAAALLALPMSLYLIAVQIWPLRRFCPMCLIVHLAVLGGTALGSPFLLDGSIVANAPRVAVWGAVHVLLFLVVLGIGVPYLEASVENRTHRARLEWIAATPWGALAEFAGRPPSDLGLADVGACLGNRGAPFRLDVLVHATCSGCPPLLDQLEALARRRPDDVGIRIHFPPRDPKVPADRELCAAFAAAGELAGGEATLRGFRLVKGAPFRYLDLAAAGSEKVLRELLPGAAPDAAVLRRSQDAVTAAGRALDRLGRGTPTLLLDGRPWDGPIEHLEVLLDRFPDALREASR